MKDNRACVNLQSNTIHRLRNAHKRRRKKKIKIEWIHRFPLAIRDFLFFQASAQASYLRCQNFWFTSCTSPSPRPFPPSLPPRFCLSLISPSSRAPLRPSPRHPPIIRLFFNSALVFRERTRKAFSVCSVLVVPVRCFLSHLLRHSGENEKHKNEEFRVSSFASPALPESESEGIFFFFRLRTCNFHR